jgi:hypothetical protein
MYCLERKEGSIKSVKFADAPQIKTFEVPSSDSDSDNTPPNEDKLSTSSNKTEHKNEIKNDAKKSPTQRQLLPEFENTSTPTMAAGNVSFLHRNTLIQLTLTKLLVTYNLT